MHTSTTLPLVYTENDHVYHINKHKMSDSCIRIDYVANEMCSWKMYALQIWVLWQYMIEYTYHGSHTFAEQFNSIDGYIGPIRALSEHPQSDFISFEARKSKKHFFVILKYRLIWTKINKIHNQ
jgi:hypothetical protein